MGYLFKWGRVAQTTGPVTPRDCALGALDTISESARGAFLVRAFARSLQPGGPNMNDQTLSTLPRAE